MVCLISPHKKRQGIFMSNYLGLRRNKRGIDTTDTHAPKGVSWQTIYSSLITKSWIRSPCSTGKLSIHDITLSSMYIF